MHTAPFAPMQPPAITTLNHLCIVALSGTLLLHLGALIMAIIMQLNA